MFVLFHLFFFLFLILFTTCSSLRLKLARLRDLFLFYDVVQKEHLHGGLSEAEIKSTFVVDLDWLKKRVGLEESLDTLI